MSDVVDFAVEAVEPVTVSASGELAERDLMSPYVWAIGDGKFGMLVRGVPRDPAYSSDTGQVWYGVSEDGVHFTMDTEPAIAPGPDPSDGGGVEDPTLVIEDGQWIVYYTGVDVARSGGQMFYATGTGPHDLVKRGIALASSKTEGNTKEATVARTPAGRWRLFYEYARDEASLVGLALGDGVAGPWHEQPQPFAPREGAWDGWHLSTGPMLGDDPSMPVMLYNGATRDARWRIGWVAFNADCTEVVDRCVMPLITPPPQPERALPDIAFAASAVSAGGRDNWLYYSVGDKELQRALVRRFAG
ncbi:glycosidase [Sphingomonas sp. ASV193]|uniref:glycosidase n=1 Tax=Sphingomonas sp. ASV193 TaxID=3144405 RepID=UPI0032E8E2C0